MTKRTFDFCALQFLNQWLEKEKSYCEMLASPDRDTQRLALAKAGGHFRVARNLPTKYEKEKSFPRYQPVLEVLDGIDEVSVSNVTNLVNQARERISGQYGGRSVLSLTTKFLWLKVKSPIRIYDKQARIALQTESGDFSAFNDAFSERYSECEEQIVEACSKLKNVLSYSVRPKIRQDEVEDMISERWFRERVLDIYLWNQGNV
ncbi:MULTISPECIES: hypothetical protein [Marinomonas]|uniref:Uncharacterized protein n=1 Tax=Marinomonas rhodophyticola TaxID=2992803 RepID=A0ABT3KCX9_9GAMM|nr:hypothetical protein [Marinomonas sp. KJ51-3]MCW4628021.1 hypothetical protein [Marinomonas sp. KJ51-3]